MKYAVSKLAFLLHRQVFRLFGMRFHCRGLRLLQIRNENLLKADTCKLDIRHFETANE